MLLVLAANVTDGAQHGSTACRPLSTVSYTTLPGTYTVTPASHADPGTFIVQVHLWIAEVSPVMLSAFAMVEDVQRLRCIHGHISHASLDWQPKLEVVDAQTGEAAEVTVRYNHELGMFRPSHFTMRFSQATSGRCVAVGIAGFSHTRHVCVPPPPNCTALAPGESWMVWNGAHAPQPTHLHSFDNYFAMIRHSIVHHQALGIQRFGLYLGAFGSRHLHKVLATDAFLADKVQQDVLHVVQWHDQGPALAHGRMCVQQHDSALIASHALLALQAQGAARETHVFMVDLDEFVNPLPPLTSALGSPPLFARAVQACTNPSATTPAYNILRYNARLPNNAKHPEATLWANYSGAPADLLANYTKDGLLPGQVGKWLVRAASGVLGFFVHQGVLDSGGKVQELIPLDIPLNCTHLLHLYSLWRVRAP